MPEILVLLSRALLAGVFAVSGVAKLASRTKTRESLVEFGVPSRFAGVSGDLLILLELVVAALLLPVSTFGYGGIGALGLLTVFCGAIAVNLLRHHKPHCNCFGQLHSTPIGWHTFARNLVIAAVAGLVAFGARDPKAISLLAWKPSSGITESLSVAFSLLDFVLLVGIGAFLLQILRQQGRLILRLEAIEQAAGIEKAIPSESTAAPQFGLPLGTAAPDFELNDLNGGRSSLKGLLQAQKPVLLLFSHADCGPCQMLVPEIAGWQRNLSKEMTIAVIAEGPAAANRAKLEPFGIKTVLLQEGREIAELYRAYGTPAAVVVDASGSMASYVAQGGDAIRNLVSTMLARRESSSTEAGHVTMGDLAPNLSFESLSGKKVLLSSSRGKETLLLFWNPQCGFCERMLPALKAWEAAALPSAPRLLVISTGSLSDNRAMGLRSSVVVDTGSKAAEAFSANGTPMAVLLDRRGRVASRVVAGAQAFFALAKSREGSAAPMSLAVEEG
jgi:thiol-disulfide isomerase/thioredoxin